MRYSSVIDGKLKNAGEGRKQQRGRFMDLCFGSHHYTKREVCHDLSFQSSLALPVKV